MSPLPFTTDDDAVPTVDRPDPDTDRGLPGVVDATVLAFVASFVALVGWRALAGDGTSLAGLPGLVSQAGTAATGAAVVRWLLD